MTKRLISDAAILRGAIITSYAQIEHLLADIILRCQIMPEYNALPQTLPYRLKTRIARVRQLVAMAGPLSQYKVDFGQIASELQQFEELRHFMAHGLLHVQTAEDGSHRLTYRMYREVKGPSIEEGVMATNLVELEEAAMKIGLYAKRALTLFHGVYKAHDLEPR